MTQWHYNDGGQQRWLTCFLLTSFFIGTAQAGFLLDDLYSYRRTYDLHSIDDALDFVLDHQLHLFSTLIAGGLAGAAVAYGVAWLLLRKHLGRSLVWYAHIIGIAVAVIGGAVFRIVAMFIYAGEDAIYPDAASGASGFYLLVIPALIALGYIWLLKSPSILFGVSSIPVVVEPLANPTIPVSRQHAMALPFASPWKRLGAVLIDSVLLLIAGALLGVLVGNVASLDTLTDPRFERRMNGYGYLLAWLYYAFMESSAKQATFGKLALGLTVTDLAGNRIGFWRATGRFFGRLISVVILLGGFIMAFFTQKRQTLHDMMAGCLVLDANVATQSATPPDDYSAPATRPASTHSSATTSTASFVPASQSFSNATRAESSPAVTTQTFAVDEDSIYAAIANELKTGAANEGLWTRLFAECDGDENRTKVAYIKARAFQLGQQSDKPAFSNLSLTGELRPPEDEAQMKRLNIWYDGTRYRYRAHQFDELHKAVAFVANQNAQQ